MPSTSPKQKRTMAAIAHDWRPSHGDVADIPVKVAKDFFKADQAKKRRGSIKKSIDKVRTASP